jgi:hypothetical protein
MKGDFSRRIFFDPSKHYAGVLHQQGRVWLDSDWNEDVFERLSLTRQETLDVVGVCGVPEPGSAFLISINPNAAVPGDFLIGGGRGNLGRAYVNGILSQLDAPTTYLTQPDLPNPPAILMPGDGSDLNAVVYLEVWQRMISALEDGLLREIALGGPDTTTRLKTVAQVRVVAVPQSTAGTLTSANAPQFLPIPSLGTLTTLQPQVTQNADLCQLPDPNNFTGRQNRLYRVEVHEGGDPIGQPVGVSLAQDAPAGTAIMFLAQSLTPSQVDAVTRSGIITVADSANNAAQASVTGISPDSKTITLTNPLTITFATANNAQVLVGGAQTLAASLAQDAPVGAMTLSLAAPLNSSQIDSVTRWGVITVLDNAGNSQKISIAGVSADGKTITLTNPLTRAFTIANLAQILGIVRFKWSRDNASFAVSVTAVSSDRRTLTLSSLGRDQATALGQGDLVEICDDASELGPSHGHLTNLQSDPDPDQLTVVISDPLPQNFQVPGNPITSPPSSPPSFLTPPDRHLVLRRWDGQGIARTGFSTTGTLDMDLGDGVHIQFG